MKVLAICKYPNGVHINVPDVLFKALSASPMRKSRARCSVERDSLIRPIAILSGTVLKFPIVW